MMNAEFLSFVFSNTVTAIGLAIFTLCVTRLWRNPHVARILWLLVLAKLISPPVIQVPLPVLVAGDGKNHIRLEATRGEPREGDMNHARLPSSLVSERAVPWAVWDFVSWPLLLLGIWSVGSLITASVFGRSHWLLNQLLRISRPPDASVERDAQGIANRMGLAAYPTILVTDAHICPLVTAGWRTAAILLPSELLAALNRDQIKAVLAHELAHLRRRDHWIRIFEVFVLALYWWNPLAWWARRMARSAEEECCDAWVVWALPGDRRAYGQALLRTVEYVTERKVVPAAVGTTFASCLLERRIDVIVNQNVDRKMTRKACFATLALGVFALPLAVTQADASVSREATASDGGQRQPTTKSLTSAAHPGRDSSGGESRNAKVVRIRGLVVTPDERRLQLKVLVSAKQVERVRVGSEAVVRIDAFPNRRIPAQVSSVIRVIEVVETNRASRRSVKEISAILSLHEVPEQAIAGLTAVAEIAPAKVNGSRRGDAEAVRARGILGTHEKDRLQVEVAVPATERGQIRVGASAVIQIDALPNRDLPGQVIRVGRGGAPDDAEASVILSFDEVPEQAIAGLTAVVEIDVMQR